MFICPTRLCQYSFFQKLTEEGRKKQLFLHCILIYNDSFLVSYFGQERRVGCWTYLLWVFGRVRRFFAPVTLHCVSFNDCTVYWDNGMGSTVMGGKPSKGEKQELRIRRVRMTNRRLKRTDVEVEQPTVDVPDEWVAFLRENSDFHYLTKRWEGLSHDVFWRTKWE